MGIRAYDKAARLRSRALGRIKQLRESILKAENEIRELEARVLGYNRELQQMGFDMDPDWIDPVVPTPKLKYFARGELIGLCLKALREQQGPLSTVQLLDYAAGTRGVRFRAPEHRAKTRASIKRMLIEYARQGIVVRLPYARTSHDESVCWVLPEFYSVATSAK